MPGDTPLNDSWAGIMGAEALVRWFGYFPSFHDAEVVSIELKRGGISRVRVHTFAMTREVNASGHYVTEKHVVVSFLLEDVFGLDLADFNHQNVLSALTVCRKEDGFELVLSGCYGVEGSIRAGRMRIEMEPGMPAGSAYAGTLGAFKLEP